MKVVLFSDLHLDTHFAWAPPRVARRRRQALRDTLVRIVDLAAEVNADALLCGGDLYEHERFSPDTGAFLCSVFERFQPKPVFIAPGNHDWYGPESLYHQAPWPANVHVFRSARLRPVALADGLTLWGAAHCAPANTDGFFDDFHAEGGGVHVALVHASERSGLVQQGEGKVPHAPFEAEQIERAGLQHAFLGHYHRARDAEQYTYPGNPEPLAFGETAPGAAVVAEIDGDGTVRRERHRVASTDVHDLEVELTGCASRQDVRDRIAGACSGRTGIARVTLIGEIAPDLDVRLDELQDAATGLESVVMRLGAVKAGYDLAALTEEQTVRGQFVRAVLDADLDDDMRRRVLMTGLRALDGRDDLEVP
jgi:DNA repair exonuclease SbcCD nuclease subunit